MAQHTYARTFNRRNSRKRKMTRSFYSRDISLPAVLSHTDLDAFTADFRKFLDASGESYEEVLRAAVERTHRESPTHDQELSEKEVAEIADDIGNSLPGLG